MKILWEGKKHWLFLPWSFTDYKLSEDRFFKKSGILSKNYEEVYLFRVQDVKTRISFLQGLWGTGTVILYTTDASSPVIELENIKDPLEVKEIISVESIKQRRANGILELI